MRRIYGQHRDWATLGFMRAIASNGAISRCLIDNHWLQTLLTMIDGSLSAIDDDDGPDDPTALCQLSLPKRVSICQLSREVPSSCLIL